MKDFLAGFLYLLLCCIFGMIFVGIIVWLVLGALELINSLNQVGLIIVLGCVFGVCIASQA